MNPIKGTNKNGKLNAARLGQINQQSGVMAQSQKPVTKPVTVTPAPVEVGRPVKGMMPKRPIIHPELHTLPKLNKI